MTLERIHRLPLLEQQQGIRVRQADVELVTDAAVFSTTGLSHLAHQVKRFLAYFGSDRKGPVDNDHEK